MSREPNYSAAALAALNGLEKGTDHRLLNAVADAIDIICDLWDQPESRREQLRTAHGTPIWKVVVRDNRHEWCVLWWPNEEDPSLADIHYIGPLPG